MKKIPDVPGRASMAERTVNFLRVVYLSYLSILPALALTGLALMGKNIIGLLLLGLIPAAIYLDMVVEKISFPRRLPQALMMLLGVPVVIAIAIWVDGGTFWEFVIYSFVVETLAIIFWLLFLAYRPGRHPDWYQLIYSLAVLFAAVLILLWPFTSVLVGVVGYSISGLIFFLIALGLSTVKHLRLPITQENSFMYIVFGCFAWFAVPAILIPLLGR